jgi:hypothetical protein
MRPIPPRIVPPNAGILVGFLRTEFGCVPTGKPGGAIRVG